MGYEVEIIADSISPAEVRLTTLTVSLPRIVLAELNTHRKFSRNSASSRAIPIQKMIDRVMTDPFVPFYWGKNQRGMQAHVEIDTASKAAAEKSWLKARDQAVKQAVELMDLGVHKELVNRLLEPWLFTTVLVSATDWGNFDGRRCHTDAQRELQRAAEMMREARAASQPKQLRLNEWHMPYARPDDSQWGEREPEILGRPMPDWPRSLWRVGQAELAYAQLLLCVARCTRVSYDATKTVHEKLDDLNVADRLIGPGHWSPFEHIAMGHASVTSG